MVGHKHITGNGARGGCVLAGLRVAPSDTAPHASPGMGRSGELAA